MLHHMRPLDAAEVRARQLRVLDTVTEHCRTFGINYYLCAGTLLGAVRHRGFIPWDDDVDLMLPREHFERLCATFGDTGKNLEMTLRAPSTDPDYHLPFAKVCDDTTMLEVTSEMVGDIGVHVDVFPLDGWFPRGPRRRIQSVRIELLAKVIQVKDPFGRQPRGRITEGLLTLARRMLAVIPAGVLARALTRAARRPGYKNSADVGVIVWGYHESVPRSSYEPGSIVSFEGRQLSAPQDVDDVLGRIYGDYMTPPPQHQRVTHHHPIAAYART
jgi:lipopolysaccharide cholinephosphotransferase